MPDDDITLHVARETVEELLDRMKVKASVTVYHGEPDDDQSRTPVNVDINGKDLSILIGRQAETLNALQYISSLIVGKELGHSIPLIIDVENYRKRRQQQIRHLARRMAEQAVKTGRRQVLEPMPANERRIIHIELRDNPQVKPRASAKSRAARLLSSSIILLAILNDELLAMHTAVTQCALCFCGQFCFRV